MSSITGPTAAMCTVRRHPTGGFTPVLHVSGRPAPAVTETGISLPTVARAAQYARNHYGTVPVLVDEECHGPVLRTA